MPSPLANVFAADAAALVDLYGESLRYIPKSGSPRMVTGIVRRLTPDNPSPSAKARPLIEITFAVSGIGGLDPNSVDFNADRIEVAVLLGGSPVQMSFAPDIQKQVAGRWKVRVR